VSEPLRYGIIGAGLMGLEHQRNLNAMPGAVVTAVADPVESSLDWARLTAGERELATFTDYRDLLRAGICDVYVIATPNFTHRDVLGDVMATGRAILVEKPLCTTVADAAAIRSAAAGYPGVLWVGLEYRYMPPIARAIALVGEGAVGDVRLVTLREHRHPFLAKVGDWNRFNRFTGGTLVEKCCHFFDLMRLIARSEPVAVAAFGGQALNHLDERYGGEVPDVLDHAVAIVEFDNGVRASLELSMFAEGTTNNEELSVVGSTGKVEAFIPSGEVRVGARAGWSGSVRTEVARDPRVLVEGFHHGASYLEHLDLAAAVRDGTPPLVSAEDGYWSVVMGVAAQRSIETRRVIEVAEIA
jgi:predicted dehydrogenase